MAWLAASGTDGVCPNGSLGEYQTLTDEERARVVQTAAEARPAGFGLMPGVAAYGSRQTQRWIEQAAEAGAESVLLLPPNTYRADSETVLDHYRAAAAVGLPIVAYNNPIDTKVDLTPDVLAQLFDEDLIVGVKEFTGDVRRAWEIAELAPGLDLLVGSDDVVVELGLAGAVGWICGYSNALPRTCVELLANATSGDPSDLAQAVPVYRDLHSLLRWDAEDRVRPGHQAEHGRRRPQGRHLPAASQGAVRDDPPPGDHRNGGRDRSGIQVANNGQHAHCGSVHHTNRASHARSKSSSPPRPAPPGPGPG